MTKIDDPKLFWNCLSSVFAIHNRFRWKTIKGWCQNQRCYCTEHHFNNANENKCFVTWLNSTKGKKYESIRIENMTFPLPKKVKLICHIEIGDESILHVGSGIILFPCPLLLPLLFMMSSSTSSHQPSSQPASHVFLALIHRYDYIMTWGTLSVSLMQSVGVSFNIRLNMKLNK